MLSNAGMPDFRSINFSSQYSVFEPEQDPVLTYQIDTREPFTNACSMCAGKYKLFSVRMECLKCSVEMVDGHIITQDHSFPVRLEDPVYSQWYSVVSSTQTRCALSDVNSIGCCSELCTDTLPKRLATNEIARIYLSLISVQSLTHAKALSMAKP